MRCEGDDWLASVDWTSNSSGAVEKRPVRPKAATKSLTGQAFLRAVGLRARKRGCFILPQTAANEEDGFMNVTARRLSSMIVVLALVATLAATTTTPAFAKKPGGDGKKSNTDFKVTMELWSFIDYPWWLHGPFKASGAIKDRGSAIQSMALDEIELQGKKGTINILLVDTVWTGWWFDLHMVALFVILGGTGDYEGLQGEGSASGDYWPGEFGGEHGELSLVGSVTSP